MQRTFSERHWGFEAAMSNYPSIYFIACLCLVCLLFVNRQLQAISTPNKAPSLNFFKVRQSNNTSQGYDGNFDIYGLGIRLGIYFQWAGAVLLKWFRGEPEVLRDLLNENGVFLLAIFIASIIFCTVGTDSPHAVDILILLHIFFGSTYIIMFDANVSDSLEKISSFWGILIKYMTTSGMAFFGVWYWFVELDRLPAIPGTGNYGFLFTKVAVRGRVLVFFKFLSILNLFIWHHALIGSILERIVYLKICKDKLKNGNKKQQQQTRGFLEVLKELSVPSPEKWEAIPPDVNIFRQCTRLLFQPRTDTFADELKPYLGDTKARTDSDAIYTLYFSPYAGAIGGQLAGLLDYLVYVACAVTFRTQKHLEEHRGDNPLSEAQEQAIQKFNDFCSHRNQDLTTPPPLPLQEWEKIALFLIGIGPTVIGLLTPKVRLDGNRNLAFEKSFPKMVNATIELAEPSFNKIINGYAKDHLPKLEWHGGSIEFGFLGPFSMPTIIYNSPKKEDTSKKSAPKKKARECLLWAKFKSLLSTFLQFW